MLDWTGGASASTSSIVVIVTGIATGVVFTVLLVCLFVTCRQKVRDAHQLKLELYRPEHARTPNVMRSRAQPRRNEKHLSLQARIHLQA